MLLICVFGYCNLKRFCTRYHYHYFRVLQWLQLPHEKPEWELAKPKGTKFKGRWSMNVTGLGNKVYSTEICIYKYILYLYMKYNIIYIYIYLFIFMMILYICYDSILGFNLCLAQASAQRRCHRVQRCAQSSCNTLAPGLAQNWCINIWRW